MSALNPNLASPGRLDRSISTPTCGPTCLWARGRIEQPSCRSAGQTRRLPLREPGWRVAPPARARWACRLPARCRRYFCRRPLPTLVCRSFGNQ